MIVNLEQEVLGRTRMPGPGWEAAYIGIPFQDGAREGDALDCWGLVTTIYAHELGIQLPHCIDAKYTRRGAGELGDYINGHEHNRDWREVPLDCVQVCDALLLRLEGYPIHVGIVADPRRSTMLHTLRGVGVIIERYMSPLWINRIEGAYRHASLVT